MSNPLFDISQYQSRKNISYTTDWIDATESDPAWDQPELHPNSENNTAEPSGDAQSNSKTAPTMAEEKTPGSNHASVEVVEELSPEEAALRQRLELKVERAFYEAGVALRELRSKRLYRSTHRTFEDYSQSRFGFTRRHVNYLIAGSQVFENLEMGTNSSQILPTSETQVRHLANLEPDAQRKIWQQAVETVEGKVPTARIVKSIVERLKQKPLTQLSVSYKRGDAFILQGLLGAERRYNGCWALADEVLEFSLKVETHDTMLLVKPENLDPIDDYTVCRELTAVVKRIGRLRKHDLDRGAEVVLESLGKQTFLTEIEEKLLKLLENHYGTA